MATPVLPKFMLIVLVAGNPAAPVKTDFLFDDMESCLDSAYFYSLNQSLVLKRRMEGRSFSESVLRPQIEHKYACIPHEGHSAGWKK